MTRRQINGCLYLVNKISVVFHLETTFPSKVMYHVRSMKNDWSHSAYF